jgi:hypothetical protein
MKKQKSARRSGFIYLPGKGLHLKPPGLACPIGCGPADRVNALKRKGKYVFAGIGVLEENEKSVMGWDIGLVSNLGMRRDFVRIQQKGRQGVKGFLGFPENLPGPARPLRNYSFSGTCVV